MSNHICYDYSTVVACEECGGRAVLAQLVREYCPFRKGWFEARAFSCESCDALLFIKLAEHNAAVAPPPPPLVIELDPKVAQILYQLPVRRRKGLAA